MTARRPNHRPTRSADWRNPDMVAVRANLLYLHARTHEEEHEAVHLIAEGLGAPCGLAARRGFGENEVLAGSLWGIGRIRIRSLAPYLAESRVGLHRRGRHQLRQEHRD